MHRIVEDGLEDYLAGRVLRDFEVHVSNCEECRGELEQIGFVSSLFRESFEVPVVEVPVVEMPGAEMPGAEMPGAKMPGAEVVPSPGFYARLNQSIEARKAPSPWAFFSIDAIFGRRVAFASLLALALVGGFLVSRESDSTLEVRPPGTEAIIAQQNPASDDATVNRNRMLYTLANYDER